MSYRSDRFNRGFRPLGDIPHSDRNHGVELIVNSLDFDWCEYHRKERRRIREYELRLDVLVVLLLLIGLGHLVPTLLLIVRNGKFRDLSIAEMTGSRSPDGKALNSAERRYERHRKLLLEII